MKSIVFHAERLRRHLLPTAGLTFIFLSLSACAGESASRTIPRIDGSSLGNYSSSVELMRQDMTESEVVTFRYALKTIEMTRTDRGQWTGNASVSPQMLDAVDGMTSDEVLELAGRLRSAYSMGS